MQGLRRKDLASDPPIVPARRPNRRVSGIKSVRGGRKAGFEPGTSSTGTPIQASPSRTGSESFRRVDSGMKVHSLSPSFEKLDQPFLSDDDGGDPQIEDLPKRQFLADLLVNVNINAPCVSPNMHILNCADRMPSATLSAGSERDLSPAFGGGFPDEGLSPVFGVREEKKK